MMKIINHGFLLVLSCLLTSCTYLRYSAIQSDYVQAQKTEPSQSNLKHIHDEGTFFVFGKTIDTSNKYAGVPLAIVAYSNKYKQNEHVDSMFSIGPEKHYGLNLPKGLYSVQVYADINKDAVFQPSELVGRKEVEINKHHYPERVVGDININLLEPFLATQKDPISMPVDNKKQESIFYPTGTIRSLDDRLFDNKIATLGLYDPASFLEHAPTMFYALEENVMHKIPIIFVHGIEGNPRSFEPILKNIDRNKYTPWFYYYPSGADLNQLGDLFYNIFLSGNVIPSSEMPMIVVAHSMGGLVVREAFNKYKGHKKENKVELFVSLATPFGGHPAAAYGEKSGFMTLPVWKDLNPNNEFIKKLYQKPLPPFLKHQLFYAYKNTRVLKLKENSDGVVPLSSQLYSSAQKQVHKSFGFNNTHVGILENKAMIAKLIEEMKKIKNIFPESSLNILADGGFDIDLDESYSPSMKHLISYAGKYFVLVSRGFIKHPRKGHFIDVIQGKVPAETDDERAFLRFMKTYKNRVDILP